MKKFFAAALLALSLISLGCKPAEDTKPPDTSASDPSGGQPGGPGAGAATDETKP